MDPLKEAIEICESMMIHKDRNGLGRLHVLLCIVQERYFLDADDTAAAAEGWDAEVHIVDDTPFPAA